MIVALQVSGNACKAQEQTLLTGKHEDSWASLSVGYVNKYWQTDFDGRIVKENIWGEEGKKIHGVQVGVHLTPCLPIGLGIHSGLFYEYYYSVSDILKEYGFNDFREHNLYMPLHGLYRIPLSPLSSISVFGGLGFNWAMWGSYNRDRVVRDIFGQVSGVESAFAEWHHYGNGEWPRHMNVQWEVGCCVRIETVQLRFTYSRGLTNHKLYTGYETRQNKIGISLEFAAKKDDE